MEKYYYEEIIKRLVDEIDNRKRIEEELRVELDRQLSEVVRVKQLLEKLKEKKKE